MTRYVLVIGYGSSLRGDDGVGGRVAAAVKSWRQPGLRALVVHQLTPELAEAVAAARVVVFVDAYRADATGELRVQPVQPGRGAEPLCHTGDPRQLLALAELIYGARPPAWLIGVPGIDFELGEELSPVAQHGLAAALRWIETLLKQERPVSCRASC